MTTPVPADPAAAAALYEQFIQIAKDTQVVNYAVMASFVCLIHDIILTFPVERDLIWKEPVTTGSVLYIFMRYGNVTEQGISVVYYIWPMAPFEFCRVWTFFQEWFAYLLFVPTTIFMGLRTFALYRGHGAFYKWFISGLVLVMNAVMFASLALVSKDIKFSPPPAPGMTCSFTISSNPKTPLLIQFIMSSCFDFSIFWLTLYRVWQHFRMGSRNIVIVIFKDSLAYYGILWTSSIVTLVLYTALPESRIALRALMIAPMKAMSVIITSRVVLNLRTILMTSGALTVGTLLTTAPHQDENRTMEPMEFHMPEFATTQTWTSQSRADSAQEYRL